MNKQTLYGVLNMSIPVFLNNGERFYFKVLGIEYVGNETYFVGYDDEGLNRKINTKQIDFVKGNRYNA